MSESNIIPEGKYNAVAVRQEGEDGSHVIRFGVAGEKKTKQCLVYFEILEGEHRGERLPWFGFFSKAAWKRTVEALKYCGFKGDDLTTVADQELNQKVQVVVEHNEREKDGDVRVYARIAWVNRIGSGAIKLNAPMSKDDVRAFAAQMKSYLSEVKDVEGEPIDNGTARGANSQTQSGPPPSVDEPPPHGIDDDIPF